MAPSITVITCFEGQIIEAVNRWILARWGDVPVHLVTDNDPLGQLTTTASSWFRSHIDYALAQGSQQQVFIVGHPDCLLHYDVTAPVQAVHTLADWAPGHKVGGLWVTAGQVTPLGLSA